MKNKSCILCAHQKQCTKFEKQCNGLCNFMGGEILYVRIIFKESNH